jgi:ATP-binding cassette, subfamily B, multidrug efflux pump
MIKNLHPKVTLEGANQTKNLWKIWRKHLWKLNNIYLLGFLATFLTGIAEVETPVFMGRSIDGLLQKTFEKKDVLLMAGVFTGLLFLQYLGRLGWRITIAQQAHHLGALMKSKLWDRIRFLPEEKITQELRSGEVMNLATSDVNMARFAFSFTLVMLADLIFIAMLGVGSMLNIHWKLTLYTLGPAIVLPHILIRLARRESREYEKAQETLSSLSDLAARCVETLRLQRLSSTELSWRKSLEQRALRYLEDKARFINTSLMFYPVMSGAALFCYAIGITLGIREVLAGRMSPGQFVSFQSLIFVVQTPLQELGFVISDWQRSFTSLKRLVKAWGEEEMPGLRAGGHPVADVKASAVHLKVENLSYSPPGQTRDLYKNLSFNLKAGDQMGVWGPIGCGKSTLFKILLGLEKNYSGSIKLVDEDLNTLSHDSLTDHVVLVPQRPFMFSTTIRDNLKLDLNLADDEIWKALEVAEVSEDFRSLPKGLDTHLGEWGINLSGGQKQRLALARALLRKPKLLLLDDCLSAVDTSTEEKILRSLKETLNCSVMWIAHRRSTLRSCTSVIQLGEENYA